VNFGCSSYFRYRLSSSNLGYGLTLAIIVYSCMINYPQSGVTRVTWHLSKLCTPSSVRNGRSHAVQISYTGRPSCSPKGRGQGQITTGPPNGPVLFRTLSSVGVVCRLTSSVTRVGGWPPPGRARGRSGGRHCTEGQYGYVPLVLHLVFYQQVAITWKRVQDIDITIM